MATRPQHELDIPQLLEDIDFFKLLEDMRTHADFQKVMKDFFGNFEERHINTAELIVIFILQSTAKIMFEDEFARRTTSSRIPMKLFDELKAFALFAKWLEIHSKWFNVREFIRLNCDRIVSFLRREFKMTLNVIRQWGASVKGH